MYLGQKLLSTKGRTFSAGRSITALLQSPATGLTDGLTNKRRRFSSRFSVEQGKTPNTGRSQSNCLEPAHISRQTTAVLPNTLCVMAALHELKDNKPWYTLLYLRCSCSVLQLFNRR